MFVRSTDGGQTFSAPRQINDDPVNPSKWHWFGTLSVAPNGRIDSVWYDTRNAANNTDSQLFYSWSTDGGVTWAPNVAVSNSFNPFEGYPNQSKIGDYITIVSDNTGGNVAYSATFNFNPNRGQHEEDVYYVRVAPSTSGLNLLSAASRLTHGSAGTFDIAMPLTGVSGVEDRSRQHLQRCLYLRCAGLPRVIPPFLAARPRSAHRLSVATKCGFRSPAWLTCRS